MSIPTHTDLNGPQAYGHACVVCRADFTATGVSHVPVGTGYYGQVFACIGDCAKAEGYVADPGEQMELEAVQ